MMCMTTKYEDPRTFKHTPIERAVIAKLRREARARKKAKLLTSGVGTAKNQTPEADTTPLTESAST